MLQYMSAVISLFTFYAYVYESIYSKIEHFTMCKVILKGF